VTGSPSTSGRGADAVLAMSGITVDFGHTVALEDVGLKVYPHQVVGVIGPNAAGKTTLFDVASGSVRPTSGRLTWRGTDLTKVNPHTMAKLGISRTMQRLSFDDRKPVLENVMVGADLPGRNGSLAALVLARSRTSRDQRELKDRAFAALNDLGIAEHAEQHPPGLPTAVRRRVALARALMRQPELLLLDELAAGLSPDERRDLGRTIRGLTRRTSVMLVEHHLDVMMSVCDHVVVLDSGRVIARGTPEDVRDDPAVVAAYLGDDDAG
jgi:branched-chain amino acid transport system ATP-binding protein